MKKITEIFRSVRPLERACLLLLLLFAACDIPEGDLNTIYHRLDSLQALISQPCTLYIQSIDTVYLEYQDPEVYDSNLANAKSIKLYADDHNRYTWKDFIRVPDSEFFTDTLMVIDTGSRPMYYYDIYDNVFYCNGDTIDPYQVWIEMLQQSGVRIE